MAGCFVAGLTGKSFSPWMTTTWGPTSGVDAGTVPVYATGMARRKNERRFEVADPYEEVYDDFRTVVETAVDRYGAGVETAIIVGNAQAEALVRTIKGFTLRGMTKRQKTEYISWLMSQILSDILDGEKGIIGRMLVREVRVKKK